MSLDEERGLYTYALFTAPDAPPAESIPEGLDAPPDILDFGSAMPAEGPNLSVLVEPVELKRWTGPQARERLQDLDWVGPRALVHEQIVQWAQARLGAVYPTSFATIYSTRDRLETSLAEQSSALLEYFELVEDCDQWTVKGFADRESIRAEFDSDQSPPTSGAEYLRRRAESDTEARVAEVIEERATELFTELAGSAREALAASPSDSRPDTQQPTFSWSFLVPRTDDSEWQACLDEYTRDARPQGIELQVSGPLAPYEFRN